MTSKATIISEIDAKTNHNYSLYRIGITDNPKERQEYWATQETTKYWKQWQADFRPTPRLSKPTLSTRRK